MINDLKKSDTWKNQLAVTINLISFKDNNEGRVTHSKSDNIKIIINDKADKGIEELFDSLIENIKLDWKDQRGVVIRISLCSFIVL